MAMNRWPRAAPGALQRIRAGLYHPLFRSAALHKAANRAIHTRAAGFEPTGAPGALRLSAPLLPAQTRRSGSKINAAYKQPVAFEYLLAGS